MNRREFLREIPAAIAVAAYTNSLFGQKLVGAEKENPSSWIDPAKAKDWLARWEKNIVADSRNRYCDKELGEELGWHVSPFLNGYYYGYQATHDLKWVEMLIDWTDSCIKRGVKEPDGFIGWPIMGGGGGNAGDFSTDSLLGEAMMLRPVVLMAGEIVQTPALKEKWEGKARSYIELAEQTYQKWDSRDCWRDVKDGGLWVVPGFGLSPQSGKWTDGYERRKTDGFSNPDNKENHMARWLLAMYDVTKKDMYRERAEKWFRLMKSRMKTREDGKYLVWNYWDPAGPWDYKPDGSAKHWIGVHPNGGYYQIDAEGIVAAFEHGLVFKQEDINRLIATNRDFMWNKQIEGAKFQRIDGGQPDPRWKTSPGALWSALVPYNYETLRKIFVANHNPSGWGGLSSTPWFLSLVRQ